LKQIQAATKRLPQVAALAKMWNERVLNIFGQEVIRMKKLFVAAAAVAVLAIFVNEFLDVDPANAQSGSRGFGGSETRSEVQRTERSFESRFWDWLQRVDYTNWAPYPGATANAYPGQSPHGAFLKMYLNRIAAGQPKKLPQGSILVKENYGKDGETLMAVTVMYRSQGYDPEHYDWYWVKYMPDGSVARTPPEKGSKLIRGRFPSCINCHAGSEGDDFAFVNDGN